jgi:hypothetical protein
MAGRKCNVNCAVYGCTSVRKKNPELSFHSFPKEGEKVNIKNGFGVEEVCNRRQLWEAKLKIGKKVSKSMKICSVHFKKEDFEHAMGYGVVRRCCCQQLSPVLIFPSQQL